MNKREILVTAALPYANGDIHIGHLVEYLQADFWVRFQKMQGHDCHYFCADDTHGTPVMIKAKELGITPEELIAGSREKHIRDFTDFEIEFDNYSSTNSPVNRELCEEIYQAMADKKHTEIRKINQLYCEHDKMFLPDRFVRGKCPKCGAEDQYGDSCDKCSSTYSPTDLLDVHCSVCKGKPVEKGSEHVFFKLNDFKEFLKSWVKDHTPPEIVNKLMEWLGEDLRDWDISRESPYFGFEIPGLPGKYFYVWVDAPIGYIASTKEWMDKNGRDFKHFWKGKGKNTELYHFIGKDIVYFHTLFWPAMLENAGFKTPDQVFVHGFLTVNGEKMSKSKGTFINGRTYLDHLEPSYLRYYYGCKLNSSTEDIDLSVGDFVARVNSDLIGKITNLASRGAQMLYKKIDGKIGKLPDDGKAIVKRAQEAGKVIAGCYEGRDFAKGLIEIRKLADEANKYFDEKEPWKTIKDNPESTREVLSTILNVFRIIAIYLKPVMPSYVKKVEELFQEKPYSWDDSQNILEDHKIAMFKHLAQRVEEEKFQKIIEETKESAADGKGEAASKLPDYIEKPDSAEITIDDFFKVDLRVAKIISAEEIPEANKLLRLKVDLGYEERELIGGLRQAYKADELPGRLVVVVANLKPRKMKFGTSQGMVTAAGPGGSEIFLLSPDSGAKPGMRIG